MPAPLMILGGFFACGVISNASALPRQTATAPRSADELAKCYKCAHSMKDTGAVARLFYWGASTEKTRTRGNSFIRHDVANAAKAVTRGALEPRELTEYTRDGVTYRMTLTRSRSWRSTLCREPKAAPRTRRAT